VYTDNYIFLIIENHDSYMIEIISLYDNVLKPTSKAEFY